MTDKEYISALRLRDDRAISRLYSEYFSQFCRAFKGRFGGDVKDLYQESVVTLWQNVLAGKLKEEDLGFSGGKLRTLQSYLFLIGKFKMLNYSRKYKEILKSDDIISFMFRDVSIDEQSLQDQTERDTIIYATVNMMKEPCAPLLNKFYWEKKNFDIIAKELKYANADSAKNQKARCFKKLKDAVKKRLEEAGLIYQDN